MTLAITGTLAEAMEEQGKFDEAEGSRRAQLARLQTLRAKAEDASSSAARLDERMSHIRYAARHGSLRPLHPPLFQSKHPNCTLFQPRLYLAEDLVEQGKFSEAEHLARDAKDKFYRLGADEDAKSADDCLLAALRGLVRAEAASRRGEEEGPSRKKQAM